MGKVKETYMDSLTKEDIEELRIEKKLEEEYEYQNYFRKQKRQKSKVQRKMR